MASTTGPITDLRASARGSHATSVAVEETIFDFSRPLYVTTICETIGVMETVRTIVCKLAPTPEQASEIDATLKAFASACDHIADVARRIHSTNKVKVQAECYKEVRSTFGLSANLAIRAIARVCAVLKVPARAHSKFDPTSVDYDARIFSFREWDWTVSLTLLHSRQRIDTRLGDRQRSALKGRKPTAAVLVKRRDGGYFLHVQLSDDAPEPIEAEGVIGLDMGVKNLAVTDDGETFSGDGVDACRRKYAPHPPDVPEGRDQERQAEAPQGPGEGESATRRTSTIRSAAA